VPDEQHSIFGEWSMYHEVDKQALTGTGEIVYVICDLHDSPAEPTARVRPNFTRWNINTGKSTINRK
jgi:hypothetical protein